MDDCFHLLSYNQHPPVPSVFGQLQDTPQMVKSDLGCVWMNILSRRIEV